MSAHIKGFLWMGLLLFIFLSSTAFAADVSSYEVYSGKKYGSNYFFAISGEVIGQALPGVESVIINGQSIPFDNELNFEAHVSLPAGQKYLTISTKYKGLRFIKQYLVIRHPSAPKTFTIRVPKQEFKRIVEPPTPIKKTVPKKRKIRRYPISKYRVSTAEVKTALPKIVINSPPPTLAPPAPPAKPESTFQKFKRWVANLFGFGKKPEKSLALLSPKEIEPVIRQEAILFIDKNAQRIIELEAGKYLRETVSSEEARAIIQDQAQKILEKEVKKMINRDIPPGAGIKIVEREIRKIILAEASNIIEAEIRKALMEMLSSQEVLGIAKSQISSATQQKIRLVLTNQSLMQMIRVSLRQEIIAMLDKEDLWNLARKTVEKEAKKTIDKTALQKAAVEAVRKEIAKNLNKLALRELLQSIIAAELNAPSTAETTVKPPLKFLSSFKAPNILSVVGKPPYELIIELEPGKILLVKRDADKYYGYIYLAQSQLWFPLQEITYKELKDLLEKGKIPASY